MLHHVNRIEKFNVPLNRAWNHCYCMECLTSATGLHTQLGTSSMQILLLSSYMHIMHSAWKLQLDLNAYTIMYTFRSIKIHTCMSR